MNLDDVSDRLIELLLVLLFIFTGVVGVIIGVLASNWVVYTASFVFSRLHELTEYLFGG